MAVAAWLAVWSRGERLTQPFQLGLQDAAILAPPDEARARFSETRALHFNAVFEPATGAMLAERAAAATFVEDHVAQIGSRAVESPQRVGPAVSMLLNRPGLLQWLEQATGCGALRAVAGRLVETRANGCDALDWHDDTGDETRRLAVVINLSDRKFTGGQFQMRRKTDRAAFFTFDHEVPGSMLVFAVDSTLVHRVTPLTSGGPRRVYAGWFLSRPERKAVALAQQS